MIYRYTKHLPKKVISTSFTVHVNSVDFAQVQFQELSGVIIDTQLIFNEHIAVLKKNKALFTFRSTNVTL